MYAARRTFYLNKEAKQTCKMDTGGTWLPEVGPVLRCMTCATHDTCHCLMLLLMHPLMHLPRPSRSEHASGQS